MVALTSQQPLSEVESWDDWQLITALQVLDEIREAREEASRGR